MMIMNIFRKHHGMNIVGQGGKIILFFLPSLIAAVWVHQVRPDIAALPSVFSLLRPLGVVWFLPGLLLWGAAVIQLLVGFSNGRLVTTGAYAVVRNPIYSSVACFILPAVSLLTQTWVYLVVSLFLFVGVRIFIVKEEQQLTRAFGSEYETYLARVGRMLPFRHLVFSGVFPTLQNPQRTLK
jgi:protein-S-isoprenylcysteine O-methyltransferase Ste14